MNTVKIALNRVSNYYSTYVHNACRQIAYAMATEKYTTTSKNAKDKFVDIFNKIIQRVSLYNSFEEILKDFMNRLNTYRNDPFLTEQEKIFQFYENTCDINLRKVFQYSASDSYGNATSTQNGFYGECDNDGILGTSGAQLLAKDPNCSISTDVSNIFRAIDCVPYTNIMDDTTFQKRKKSGIAPDINSNSFKSTASLSGAALNSLSTKQYDYYEIKKYDSSGKVVVKDYNVDLYLINSKNETQTVSTYDDSDSKHKIFFKWMCSILPSIFDRIEAATGLRPGVPYHDTSPSKRRRIYWNAYSGVSVSGFVNTGINSQAKFLNMSPVAESNFLESTYNSYSKKPYNFIYHTDATIKKADIKHLANSGGTGNGWQTTADILEHEMMHYTQFTNLLQETSIYPGWWKEGWADLIRGSTFVRYASEKGSETYGHWGRLFFRHSVKDDKRNDVFLGFEDVLTTSSISVPTSYRHIVYAAGFAFWKFFFKSVGRLWDGQYANLPVITGSNKDVTSASLDRSNDRYIRQIQSSITRDTPSKTKPWVFIRNYLRYMHSCRHSSCLLHNGTSYQYCFHNNYALHNKAMQFAIMDGNNCQYGSKAYTSLREVLDDLKTDLANSGITRLKTIDDINKIKKFLKDKCGIDITVAMKLNDNGSVSRDSTPDKWWEEEEDAGSIWGYDMAGGNKVNTVNLIENTRPADPLALHTVDTTNKTFVSEVIHRDSITAGSSDSGSGITVIWPNYVTNGNDTIRSFYEEDKNMLCYLKTWWLPQSMALYYKYFDVHEDNSLTGSPLTVKISISSNPKIEQSKNRNGYAATGSTITNTANRNGTKVRFGYIGSVLEIAINSDVYVARDGKSNYLDTSTTAKARSYCMKDKPVITEKTIFHEYGHFIINSYIHFAQGQTSKLTWFNESIADFIMGQDLMRGAEMINMVIRGPSYLQQKFDQTQGETDCAYVFGNLLLKYLIHKCTVN